MFDHPCSQFELITKTKVQARKSHWNLSPPQLYEEIIQRSEAMMAESGPLVVYTGKCTGRSPNDKFFLSEPSCQEHVYGVKPTTFQRRNSRGSMSAVLGILH